MSAMDSDTAMRLAAFAHIRRLLELRDALTANDLKPGFQFEGSRIPLINPQRGIFKPTQMKYLLSIKIGVPEARRESLVRRSAGGAPADLLQRGDHEYAFMRDRSEPDRTCDRDVATGSSGCREVP